MKRYIVLLLALLVIPVCAVEAQGKKKGKKEVSPVLEGRKKVRKSDYEKVWKFTAFNAKKKTMYYCEFDYTQMLDLVNQKKPDWQEFTPVINYLTTNSRAAVTMVAIYALNPAITDDDVRAELTSRANEEAVMAQADFEHWCIERQQMKNKMVLQVAQVDFRYWHGTDFFNMEVPQDSIIPLGYLIALTNKKVEIFPDATAGARSFKDIKFFPNDATVVASYVPVIDSLADYVMGNDRYEVLLTGYSDNVGTVAYNRGLSNQRATEIKKMLMQRGVPEYRIEVVARGENDPIGDNNTYEGRIANNRVSVKIQ